MAKPTSLSSSSLVDEWSYDVFLSFRGLDTRLGFTGHLNHALCERGIKTFMDDQRLEKGEEITSALIKGIEESRIAMVIFSENYASSAFCLQELVTIMECYKHKSRLVWPVFYKVDPSDVRHQKGSYAEALAKHETRISDKDKVEKWRLALQEAASLSGWHLENKSEIVFIQDIIEGVSKKINGSPLYVAKHLVGLNHEESLGLVSWNAFGVKLVKTYSLKFPETNDLPLSLEKIGSSFSEKRLAADAYGISQPEEILRQTEKGEREKKEMREGKEKERRRSTGRERYAERQKSGGRDWERERSKSVGGNRVSGRINSIGRYNGSARSKSMGRDGVRGRSNNMGRDEVRERSNNMGKDDVIQRSNSGGMDGVKERINNVGRSNSRRRNKSMDKYEVRGRSNRMRKISEKEKYGEKSEIRMEKEGAREREKKEKRSNSRGRSNSRSNSRGRSNSRSNSRGRSNSRRRSNSRGRSNVRSNSSRRSNSRGRSNSRSNSRGRSNSRNNSRGRSNSRSNSRGRSNSKSNSRRRSNSSRRSNSRGRNNSKGRDNVRERRNHGRRDWVRQKSNRMGKMR